MEVFIYSIDGEEVKVSKAGQDAFLNEYPDAVLIRTEQPEDTNFQPGTTNVGVTEVPANIQTPDTGFKPADSFSASQED